MKPTLVSSHLLLVLCAATAVMPTGHLAAQGGRTRVLGFTQSNPYAQTGPETPVEALGRLLFWDPSFPARRTLLVRRAITPISRTRTAARFRWEPVPSVWDRRARTSSKGRFRLSSAMLRPCSTAPSTGWTDAGGGR